jgi:hypothetical protein
MAKAQIGQ